MRRFILPFYLLLGACMPVTSQDTATMSAVASVADSGLPPIKVFSAPRPMPPRVSNDDLKRDFLDLAFMLESGRALPVLTRFDGPISVQVTGAPPPSLAPDLSRLIFRLRGEAGLNITQITQGSANITIEAVSRGAIRRTLPQAACFVAPNVSSLAEYRNARRSQKVNWSRLTQRSRIAIFLPNDASPQEVRDCLHEELAQALGPLNDLYRLPDSVFNDDNVHTVLTGYDMLVLRIFYDSALRNGMRRGEVARRLPAILARLNPAGETVAHNRLRSTPRAWIDAIQQALGPGANPTQREAAAREAVKIAATMGWNDHRRGFSHYAMGRILQGRDARGAQAQFTLADGYFSATPGTDLHRAYTASQLAAYAISQNRPDDALAMLGRTIDTAARYENAALLATLMLLRAEALDLAGRASEGREVRMDSLGWARYGFGPDWAVRAKLREIGSLNPLRADMGRI